MYKRAKKFDAKCVKPDRENGFGALALEVPSGCGIGNYIAAVEGKLNVEERSTVHAIAR